MKKIVIIGGGFAGAHIARRLQNIYHVTLIDTKDYFEFTPGILRTIVSPKHMKKIQVLHTHYLHTTKLLRGEVTEFTAQDVFVGKKKIPYDYLFVCSGSRYNTPIKEKNVVLPNRADSLRKAHHQLESAKEVLIVGGGIVGVELAAEIIDFYPQKHLTLVHSKACLMERCDSQIQNYVENYFEKKGVTILYNQRLETKLGKFLLSSGEEVKTDLCFFCIGISPNTELFRKHFSSCLNERKQVIVDETLQLKGYPHIFVVGDLNDVAEEKTAQGAEKQAEIAVHNVLALEQKQKLESYHTFPKVMVISLGRFRAVLTYKQFVLTGFLPALMKWFVEWKTMMRYR
ncbi:hypothetical protein EXS74_01735 [Candidatus Woesearchaeota archaeon]|nr:hypothetical protein [Candidatus Woesearchaeota archaeon]